MKKQILIEFIEKNLSSRQIAEEVDKSQTTIKYWLKKYNLKTKHRQHNKKEDIRYCELCDNKVNKYGGYSKNICGSCNTRIRRYRTKTKAIELLGGKCNRCGWSGHIAAYEFHHIKGDKEFNIGSANNKAWSSIINELKKCELLCSNCHRIEHSKFGLDDKFMEKVYNEL